MSRGMVEFRILIIHTRDDVGIGIMDLSALAGTTSAALLARQPVPAVQQRFCVHNNLTVHVVHVHAPPSELPPTTHARHRVKLRAKLLFWRQNALSSVQRNQKRSASR